MSVVRHPATRNGGRYRQLALGPANTRGLPAMPPEMIHEIAGHFKEVPLPAPPYPTLLSRSDYDRRRSLLAFSITCSRIYHVLKNSYWRHLEALATPVRPSREGMVLEADRDILSVRILHQKLIALSLANQIDFLNEFPSYTHHVR